MSHSVLNSRDLSQPTAAPVPDTAASRRSRVARLRALRAGKGLVGVAAAIGIWQAVVSLSIVNSANLASPGAVVKAIGDNHSRILDTLGETTKGWLLSILVATVLGVALGLLIGLSRTADSFLDWALRAVRPLPVIGLIPIAILVAGLGLRMVVGLVAFAAIWPVLINTRYGVRSVEPRLIDSGRVLGFSTPALIGKVILPSIIPEIISGIRVALSIGLVVIISVELLIGTEGLGGLVAAAEQGGAVSLIYAGIVVGGALGYFTNVVLNLVERLVVPWKAESRRSR